MDDMPTTNIKIYRRFTITNLYGQDDTIAFFVYRELSSVKWIAQVDSEEGLSPIFGYADTPEDAVCSFIWQ